MIPKFTVGVNDIPELEKRNQSYVACKLILNFELLLFSNINKKGTPDSIFQIKSDLYDLLVTLPTPSFHHPIQGTNKNSTRQQQNIALSDLSSNQPDFKSNTLPIKHNTADFTRFRIMWKQLLSSTSTSWAEFVASEPNDLFGTTTALVTGVYYWLYEETPETSSTSRFLSSWQDMFAGNHRRRRPSQTPSFLINNREAGGGSDNQNLLLDEDEEDAMEINNNQVFEAVIARASTEMNRSANEDVAITEDNEFLLG
jgi:hypothetical protein